MQIPSFEVKTPTSSVHKTQFDEPVFPPEPPDARNNFPKLCRRTNATRGCGVVQR